MRLLSEVEERHIVTDMIGNMLDRLLYRADIQNHDGQPVSSSGAARHTLRLPGCSPLAAMPITSRNRHRAY